MIIKIPDKWKIPLVIFFLSSILVPLFIWSYAIISEPKSDTYIFIYEINNSKTVEELKLNSEKTKVNVEILEALNNNFDVPNVNYPVSLRNVNYSDGEKLYSIIVENRGDGTAKNVKLDLNFFKSSIQNIDIYNENRVEIIDGGRKTSSFAIFKMDELLPSESQNIDIIVKGDGLTNYGSWTDTKKENFDMYLLTMNLIPE